MLADCLRDLGVGVVSLCGRCPCLSGDSLTRGPGARTYNGQGLPRRSLSNSYAQVKGDIGTSGQAVCKTVGAVRSQGSLRRQDSERPSDLRQRHPVALRPIQLFRPGAVSTAMRGTGAEQNLAMTVACLTHAETAPAA